MTIEDNDRRILLESMDEYERLCETPGADQFRIIELERIINAIVSMEEQS